jgi:peptide/nickel transport system ATP-binding protein
VTGTLLSARALEVTFPGPWAGVRTPKGVDGVDLDVAPGEVLALVGESGCGKTTLARTLLGLEQPSAGTVSYGGDALRYGSGRCAPTGDRSS